MTTRSLTLLAVVGLLAGSMPSAAAAAPVPSAGAATQPRAGDPIPGRVIVRYGKGATAAERSAARSAVGADHAKGSHRLNQDGIELLTTSLPVDVAITRLHGRRGVVYAEPDRYVSTEAPPNDPYYPDQWALDELQDRDIDAPAAWSITTGSSSIVVAIIDSGVQLDHPDLAANIWTNVGEVPGNGRDDDDNGFVDDVHGWDFWGEDNDPADENGHGTHVAGIVAARQNNAIGTSGVAPNSKLMALRMIGSAGLGSVSDGVSALDYAWRNGARIANLSWGYSGGVEQPLLDEINIAGTHGLLVVAAAGNAGVDIDTSPFYPAGLPSTNLISVAATDEDGNLASFSNTGAQGVDLAAPGVNIWSSYAGGVFAQISGTSMASPHVAGVAALLLAANPTWTVTQLRVRIFQTVRPLAGLAGKVATGGLLNARSALVGVVDKPPVVTITSPTGGSTFLPGTAVHLTATALDPENGDVGLSLHWTSSIQGPLGTGASLTRTLVPGDHVITAMASDSGGHHPIRAITLTIGPKLTRIAAYSSNDVPSITVTPGGTPTVAWIKNAIGTYVATRTGTSTWTPALVLASEDDRQVDVAVGPDGVLRAAINRNWSSTNVYSDPGVMLGEKIGSTWKVERLTESCRDGSEGCGVNTNPRLLYDASGSLHVATTQSNSVFGPGTVGPAVLHLWRTSTGAIASETIHGGTLPSNAMLAEGSSGTLHAVWKEWAGTTPGVWYATRAGGSWVATRLSTSAADVPPQIAVDGSNEVSVVFADAAGIRLRTRTAGGWSPLLSSPATLVVPGTFADIDLAQDAGGDLHLALGRTDGNQTASGIVYASNHGSGWTTHDVTSGQAVRPSIALDAAGNAHMAYNAAWPSPTIMYATNASGSWTSQSVIASATYSVLGYDVDARGVAQAAIGRYGTAPGIFLGTRSGAAWSLSRVTSTPAEGVGFATSSIGEAHLIYGTNQGIYYATNASGSWKTTRLGPNQSSGRRSLVLDYAGHVHIAFRGQVGKTTGLVYATNKSGTWVSTLVAAGNFVDPALVVDPAGKARIAARQDIAGESRIYVTSNVTGTWTLPDQISTGGYDFDPVIAVDPEGDTSVAYWRDGGGVRLTEHRPAGWATRLVQIGQSPILPQLVIDSTGLRHIFYDDGSYNYAICGVPNCPDYPGAHEVTAGDTGPFTDHRVTFRGDDVPRALDRGRDGRLAGAFDRISSGIYEVTLQSPPPKTATTIDDQSPASIPHAGPAKLTGRLHAGATNLAGRTLVFKVDGVQIGTALTNASGVASLSWTPTVAAGAHTLTIGFSGASTYRAARVGPRALTVQP